MTTTLAIADDHELLRDAFSGHAARAAGFEVVASVGDAQSAVNFCRGPNPPELLLLDIEMPGRDALAAIADIRAASPRTKVVILTAYCRDSFIQIALQEGVWGYLVKSDPPAVIFEALNTIAQGTRAYSKSVVSRLSRGGTDRGQPRGPATRLSDLTPRELEVLRYIGRGMENEQMARAMSLSKRTVERHVARLMDCLSIRERAGLQSFAYEQGLIA